MPNKPEVPRTNDLTCPKVTNLKQFSSEIARELERVLASPAFRGSPRSLRVLRHLVEHALNGDSESLRERTLGFELFGRDAAYDTGQDSIVRVAATDIRKRLAEHYEKTGVSDPGAIRIILPVGSYVPEFQLIDSKADLAAELLTTTESEAPPPSAVPQTRPFSRNVKLALLVSAVALCSAGLSLWIQPRIAGSGMSARFDTTRPTLDPLWSQLFANGRPTCVVLSDACLILFEDLVRASVDLEAYNKKQFTDIAIRALPSADKREYAALLMAHYFTSITDGNVASRVGTLNGIHHLHTDVVFARDFTTPYFDTHNVILLGSLRANPWLNLFENQLCFRSGFTEGPPPSAFFQNHDPRPGESMAYSEVWEHVAYCRVAFLPNLRRNGNVLIISGTDSLSTVAGGDFITSEVWVRRLRDLLGTKSGKPFPYFEVLLRADLVFDAVQKFELVAWRIH